MTSNEALKMYYNSLRLPTKMEFRRAVLEQCGIHPNTFRRWLNGASKIKEENKEILNNIAKLDIFSFAE